MKPPFELPLRIISDGTLSDRRYEIYSGLKCIAYGLTEHQTEFLLLALNSFEPLVEIAERYETIVIDNEIYEPLEKVRSVLEAINNAK